MQLDSFKQFFTKPPILFPLAALFHIIISLSAIVSLYPTPITQIDWARPIGMLIFSLSSITLCSMRKWSAIGYVSISIVSFALIYFSKPDTIGHFLGDSFLPFNLILSFFILLLFKKFK
jgi:hypothetical protein